MVYWNVRWYNFIINIGYQQILHFTLWFHFTMIFLYFKNKGIPIRRNTINTKECKSLVYLQQSLKCQDVKKNWYIMRWPLGCGKKPHHSLSSHIKASSFYIFHSLHLREWESFPSDIRQSNQSCTTYIVRIVSYEK